MRSTVPLIKPVVLKKNRWHPKFSMAKFWRNTGLLLLWRNQGCAFLENDVLQTSQDHEISAMNESIAKTRQMKRRGPSLWNSWPETTIPVCALERDKRWLGTKKRVQKRLLTDTMQNLCDKFCAENASSAVSYSQFSRLRPFWVVAPSAKDRDTCMCRKHENVQLKCDKLYQLKCLGVKNAECLLPQLCCSTEDRKCMGRKCDYCRDSVIQYKADGAPDGNLTFWWEWATELSSYDKNGVTKISRIMKKQLKHGTVEDLKKLMEQDVKNVLCPHVYNIRHQFSAYKTLKNSLRSQEAVLHIDFSENQ